MKLRSGKQTGMKTDLIKISGPVKASEPVKAAKDEIGTILFETRTMKVIVFKEKGVSRIETKYYDDNMNEIWVHKHYEKEQKHNDIEKEMIAEFKSFYANVSCPLSDENVYELLRITKKYNKLIMSDKVKYAHFIGTIRERFIDFRKILRKRKGNGNGKLIKELSKQLYMYKIIK